MISDSPYAETHQCFLAKSILELKTRENKRTVGTSSPRHKKYTSDSVGVARQPKMAANIVTSSPFQKIKTVSRIRQNERLIRQETRKQTYHCSQT